MGLATELARITGAKTDIADAIAAKGITVPSGTKIDGMAALIADITGGGGTPAKGFLPTAWGENGLVTEGIIYGIVSLPAGFLANVNNTTGQFICMTDVSFSEGTTAIGAYAFAYCIVLALTLLPAGITSIGTYAFNYCGVLALESLPTGVTSISSYTFNYCIALALTLLPAGITSIGTCAFRGCVALTTMSILGNPTIAGSSTTSGSFKDCTGLTSVTVGASGKPMDATKLPAYAFYGCTNLVDITVYTTGGASLSTAPFGAANATITYLAA